MEEKAIELLENLANQLGVAVPYLWEVLVRQAGLQLVSEFMAMVLFFVFMVMAIIFNLKYVVGKEFERNAYSDFKYISDMGKVVGGGLVGAVFCIMFIVSLFNFIIDFSTMFFNPEYWAFVKIMSML